MTENNLAKMDSLLKKWMEQWHASYMAANPESSEEESLRAFLHSLHYGLFNYPKLRGIDVSIPWMSSEDNEVIYSIR